MVEFDTLLAAAGGGGNGLIIAYLVWDKMQQKRMQKHRDNGGHPLRPDMESLKKEIKDLGGKVESLKDAGQREHSAIRERLSAVETKLGMRDR